MNEQAEQTWTRPAAAPAKIEVEDFMEAVTRGIARALGTRDDVGGYLSANPRIIWGGAVDVRDILGPKFPIFGGGGGNTGGGTGPIMMGGPAGPAA